ncbi:MAG: hypothetical protein ABI597_11605 [Gammaproteobacteria bacterium]
MLRKFFGKKDANTSVQAEDPRKNNKTVPFVRVSHQYTDDEDNTQAKSSFSCCMWKTKSKKQAPLDSSSFDFEALDADPNVDKVLGTRRKYSL